ncbi:MAG: hypothetical protein NPIRA06_28010 [Nitrospirales bacterium]|nr:MAG: hypothetical protein NPIRA06_28010 [Nitrospirales bacterium]
MKTLKALFFVLMSFQSFIMVASAEQVIKGEVLLVGASGDTEPAGLVSVSLAGTGKATETDDLGQFIFDLPSHITFGKTLTFRVQKEINQISWRIWNPIDGTLPLPRSLFVTIKLLPQGSKKFWTDEFIEYYIAKIAEEAKREVRPSMEIPAIQPKIHFGALIKEWASEYGFSSNEAKQQIDQWVAEVKVNQEDVFKLGLAAYVEQQFSKAAELFDTYAENHAKEYAQLMDQAESHRQKAIQGYRKAGDSLYGNYQFEQALKEYEHAPPYIKKEDELELWANLQMDIAQANWAIGVRTKGPALYKHLRQAKTTYSEAGTVHKNLGNMEGWAAAQVGLGNTLSQEGIRVGGKEGQQRLSESMNAFRQALTVYTREAFPQDWAATQNNLGNVRTEQAIRLSGTEGHQHLAQAEEAFRQALTVYTREAFPQDWATTQNNLGNVLTEQGIRTASQEGQRFVGEAVKAFRQILRIRTREESPQDWAATQNNLGNALTAQGIRLGGEAGRQRLIEAVKAFQQALTVYTRKELAPMWAATQNNLGNVRTEQGIRLNGTEGHQHLAQAEKAFRQALTVYTREEFPQDWAATQNNLGNVRTEQGIRLGETEGHQHLAQAEKAFRQALTVYTREVFPQDWAATQNNLGNVYREQGSRYTGEEGGSLLAKAIRAFEQALKVRTMESTPRPWAQTQVALARTARDIENWEQAVGSFRKVMLLYPDYAEAYHNLYAIFHDKIFAYKKALALTSQWLTNHPNDLVAQTNFAEAHFTTGQFDKTRQQIASLLEKPGVAPSTQIALRLLNIAALLAQEKVHEVPSELGTVRSLLRQQPEEFALEWEFAGSKHFIVQDTRFNSSRDILLPLFEGFEGDKIPNMVLAVANAQTFFISATPRKEQP